MIAENLSDGWYEYSGNNKKRGGQKRYSDKAILMCLEIRYLFGLKLRQSQGFINWIFEISGLPLTCPDYTTLSKRGKKLNLDSLLDSKDSDFDYLCLDSTGIQTYTGNEWLENKHGKQYIRRTWKKLHIATGNNGMITGATTKPYSPTTTLYLSDIIVNSLIIAHKLIIHHPSIVDQQNITIPIDNAS